MDAIKSPWTSTNNRKTKNRCHNVTKLAPGITQSCRPLPLWHKQHLRRRGVSSSATRLRAGGFEVHTPVTSNRQHASRVCWYWYSSHTIGWSAISDESCHDHHPETMLFPANRHKKSMIEGFLLNDTSASILWSLATFNVISHLFSHRK